MFSVMSRHIQFRLDGPTAKELDVFIAEFHEKQPEAELSQGDAVRLLIRTALKQPDLRIRAHEIVAFTTSMHLRVFAYVVNLLKEQGIDYESSAAKRGPIDPDVAEEPTD